MKQASACVVCLDFLRSLGEPAQHHGLAGLAEVLQHSSLRPRSKSQLKEGFDRKNCSESNSKDNQCIVVEKGTQRWWAGCKARSRISQ